MRLCPQSIHSFIRLTYYLFHSVFICLESASSKSACVGVLICTFIPVCVFVTYAAFCLFSFSLNAVIRLFFYFINICLSSDPVLVSRWAFLWTLPIYSMLYSNTELGFIEIMMLFSYTVSLNVVFKLLLFKNPRPCFETVCLNLR